ncbi:unnamed protein product [Tenebrio molitor]|nr:unnamed protein product [Tenebrio molitor]
MKVIHGLCTWRDSDRINGSNTLVAVSFRCVFGKIHEATFS